MPKRNLVITYVCLVGLPLLCLIGVLRAGQRLVAPVSVSGAWTMDVNLDSIANAPCRELLSNLKPPNFSISQSGKSLVIGLNNPQKTVLAGSIEGTAITIGGAAGTSAGTSTECRDPKAIQVNANVSRQDNRPVLTGTVRILDCPTCAPVSLRATRDIISKTGTH
jgi:hypothetical protein